jgi:hypothetical protein
MVSHLTGTQIYPGSADKAEIACDPLAGDWPMLEEAEKPSTGIMERIKSAGTGAAISTHLSYLSLGHFFLCTDLITILRPLFFCVSRPFLYRHRSFNSTPSSKANQ